MASEMPMKLSGLLRTIQKNRPFQTQAYKSLKRYSLVIYILGESDFMSCLKKMGQNRLRIDIVVCVQTLKKSATWRENIIA